MAVETLHTGRSIPTREGVFSPIPASLIHDVAIAYDEAHSINDNLSFLQGVSASRTEGLQTLLTAYEAVTPINRRGKLYRTREMNKIKKTLAEEPLETAFIRRTIIDHAVTIPIDETFINDLGKIVTATSEDTPATVFEKLHDRQAKETMHWYTRQFGPVELRVREDGEHARINFVAEADDHKYKKVQRIKKNELTHEEKEALGDSLLYETGRVGEFSREHAEAIRHIDDAEEYSEELDVAHEALMLSEELLVSVFTEKGAALPDNLKRILLNAIYIAEMRPLEEDDDVRNL